MADIWMLAAVAAKLGLYVGVLTASGTVFASAAFGLSGTSKTAVIFAIVGLIAAVVGVMIAGARLTGDAAGMIDPDMLGLLWQTPVGTALAYQVAGLGLVLLGLALGGAGQWVSVLGAMIAIWSFDHVGHVPDQGMPLLDIALTLHLMAAALWIGILLPLTRLAARPETRTEAANVGHEFGKMAMITVPILILVGGVMGYRLVGSVPALVTTGYGRVLVLKVVMVGLLLGLAAANKLWFVPRMRAGNDQAAVHLVRSIWIEWGLILLILAATAILTTTQTLPT